MAGGHVANKILTPLQNPLFLISSNPPPNRRATVGAVDGLWQGLLSTGGGSSVLNLPCAKDQANENCEHRSGIYQIF